MTQRIDISPEMIAFVGHGPTDRTKRPADPLTLTFRCGDATVSTAGDDEDADLVLVVAAEACNRIFGFAPSGEFTAWHLASPIRTVMLGILDCTLAEPARETLRAGKCIELLCLVVEALREDTLVPANAMGDWSELDTQRIVAARRMIDDRWREKLTLDDIARACGLNRTKLTRGFRDLYACTISDAIAERRLGGARQLLLASDLPISSIGYRCGYLNNASFTRAFSRRFGEAPSQMRIHRVAA